MARIAAYDIGTQDLIDELERRGVLGGGGQDWTYAIGDAPARVIRQEEYERLTRFMNEVGLISAIIGGTVAAEPGRTADAVRTAVHRITSGVAKAEEILDLPSDGLVIERFQRVVRRLMDGEKVAKEEWIGAAIQGYGPVLVVRRGE